MADPEAPCLAAAAVARWRRWLAAGVRAAHVAIVVFFVVGWALPWTVTLVLVVIGAPLIHMGWWLCADRCILTVLERRLLGSGSPTTLREPVAGETTFIASVLEPLLGRPVSADLIAKLSYGVLWSSFTIATIRLGVRWSG